MIAKDKMLHFIAGFLITVIFSYIAYLQGLDYPQGYGLAIGIFTGIAKEAWDYYDYGKADFMDLMSTFAGAWFGGVLVVML